MKIIDQFRILDLFSGAGGMSYGMHHNPHFHTVVALDYNKDAAYTFQKNMPLATVVTGDITNPSIQSQIIKESQQRAVNMIIGGPPCQGFSMKGKKLGLKDERNYLFREYLKLVESLRPEVFVIENVKALLTTANGWFRDEILAYIRALGYKVRYGVLNAKDFGVPQSRERAIFICSLSKCVSLPKSNIEKEVTVKDAISDLAYLDSSEGDFEADYRFPPLSEYQSLMRTGSMKLYNHKASAHSLLAIEKLKMIPPEGNKKSLPKELLGHQKFNTTWGRLSWEKVSPTIDTRFDTPSNGTNSHPELHRSITPREAARLQSFDDAFIFYGPKVSIRAQIGNAVPPLMAKAIADSIWQTYESDFEFSSKSDEHENNLDNSFKKEHGIFYTDLDLARDIVEFLNIPQDAKCIDPWCGTGCFLYALKKFGGIKDIRGCDFDSATVAKCRELNHTDQVVCVDTLATHPAVVTQRLGFKQFDYLISNPPYAPIAKEVKLNGDAKFNKLVNQSGANLFIAAIYRAFGYVKPAGVISLVIPKNFLHISSYATIRKHLLANVNILSIIELGIHFKEVRGEQIVLTIQNDHNPDNTVKIFDYNDGNITFLSQVPQSYYSDEIISFANPRDISLYDKLRNPKNYITLGSIITAPVHRGRLKSSEAIRGKQIRKFGIRDTTLTPLKGDQLFVQNIFSAEAGITGCYGGDLPAQETVTVIHVPEDRAKYILGLLMSRVCNYFLIRFLFNNSRLTIHTDGKYLNRIPIPNPSIWDDEISRIVEDLEQSPYMGDKWFAQNDRLNECVYGLYNLNSRDREHIESEMRKISSMKWYPQLPLNQIEYE
ncbi:MAG: DNA (cytosine-5-)-methyltransferase [Bacteroidales bacterium]|nr:DNA (cytosine-5-)-methyltransferase [Bacteroidales bacterium]